MSISLKRYTVGMPISYYLDKKYFKIFLFVGCIVVFFFSFSHYADAVIPFGGRTLTIIPCDIGTLTTVGPPVGGQYMYFPGTRTYLYGPPAPGKWLLGNAGPVAICTISGFPVGGGLTMIMLGSSGI